IGAAVLPAKASDRYTDRPPVVVSPDLAAPWVMQLRHNPVSGWQARSRQIPDQTYGWGTRTNGWQARTKQLPPQTYPRVRWQPQPDAVATAAVPPQPQMYTKEEMQRKLDPKFLPREIAYDGAEKPGTIIIDSGEKFLYFVLPGGKARRYGVGVGKEGFGWS